VKVLLWLDTETTGLYPGPGHALLEIALVVTDLNFEILGQVSTLVPADTQAAFEVAEPFVKNMHTENGLWADHTDFMQLFGADLAPATNALQDYLITWAAQYGLFPGDRSTLFCAQGAVGVDNDFLRAYLPRVRELWGHRALDMSAWRDLIFKWYGCRSPERAGTRHRALDDCLAMIETAKWARQMFWKPVV
jgi:oligoribonuclease